MKEVQPLRNAGNVIRVSMHFVEVQIMRMRIDPIYYYFISSILHFLVNFLQLFNGILGNYLKF